MWNRKDLDCPEISPTGGTVHHALNLPQKWHMATGTRNKLQKLNLSSRLSWILAHVWVSGITKASLFLGLWGGSQRGWNPQKILGEKKAWSTTRMHIRKCCQTVGTWERAGINTWSNRKGTRDPELKISNYRMWGSAWSNSLNPKGSCVFS